MNRDLGLCRRLGSGLRLGVNLRAKGTDHDFQSIHGREESAEPHTFTGVTRDPASREPPERITVNQRAALLPPGRGPDRAFVVDDHQLVRLGLQDLLETAGFVVVGMSGSAKEATRLVPALRPDLAVIDTSLPDGSAIEVCRDVRSAAPSVNCLILTSNNDAHAMHGVVLAGALGYVVKGLDGGSMLVKLGFKRRSQERLPSAHTPEAGNGDRPSGLTGQGE